MLYHLVSKKKMHIADKFEHLALKLRICFQVVHVIAVVSIFLVQIDAFFLSRNLVSRFFGTDVLVESDGFQIA